MTQMIKSIRGIVVRQPTDLDYSTFNLTKSGRTASGKMVMDIIAKKRRFDFAYDLVSGPEFDKIREAIDHPDHAFFPVVYLDNGVEKTMIAYAGAIKARRFRTDGRWYWRNLTFSLIEQ